VPFGLVPPSIDAQTQVGRQGSMDTLVIGLGNVLASDDAAGIEVVRALSSRGLPPDVRVVEGATVGLGLIDLILDTGRAILVDAVRGGASPGTVLRLNERELSRAALRPFSAHNLGLVEVLKLGDVLYAERMPREIILFGIVAECVEPYREGLSPSVRAAIPRAVDAIMAEIARQ